VGAEQECDYPSRSSISTCPLPPTTLETSSCKIISYTFLLPIVHVGALRIKVAHVGRVGGLSEMLLLIMV